MRSLLAIVVAAWLAAAGAEASCFGGLCQGEKVPSCTRLPLFVRPTDYFIQLKFPSIDSDIYEGKVIIKIDFPFFLQMERSWTNLSHKRKFAELIRGFSSEKELCESNFILLHAGDNLDIKRVDVLRDSFLARLGLRKQTLKQRKISGWARIEETGHLAIKLAHGFYPSEQNIIVIEFKGKMRQDKRGIYVSTYNDGQNVYKHIVSQFQPTDARTAFPCFDEPRFRANFSLALIHDSALTALGNTEVDTIPKMIDADLSITRFVTTPTMPVHMVAFVIGQFDQLETTVNDVKVRVLTAPGKRDAGRFAIHVATDSLIYFEEYIDFKFPLTKLDVVAIADHDKDNTESWGLVFVRDTLLWIDDETKPDTRVTTAVNVAHVVVHQWFGNLISAAWWSDLWITEGVAAQFAFKIVRDLYPFQSEYFVRLGILTSAMQMDQPGQLHSLAPPSERLQTTEQIYGMFDRVQFMKSAAMAEIMSDLFQPGKYQAALRRLMRSRAYKTVTVDDYWNALLLNGYSPKVLKLIKAFISFEGVPLINVKAYRSQKRLNCMIETFAHARKSITVYDLSPAQDIRILARALFGLGATGEQTIDSVDLQAWSGYYMSQSVKWPEGSVGLEEPTSYFKLGPNPTIASYFRTRYSDELLDRLGLAVQNKWISPMDRLQLLDDSNQLARAGLISAATFGKLVEAYAQEDDSAVLIQMLAVSKTLVGLKQTDALASLELALMGVFERHGFHVTGRESFLQQRARQVVLKALIALGHQQVIEAAVEAFRNANGDIELFLREPVYMAVAVSGSGQVVSLLVKLSKTKSYEEQMRLIEALSLSRNKQVLKKSLDLIKASGLKAETVNPHVRAIRIGLSR